MRGCRATNGETAANSQASAVDILLRVDELLNVEYGAHSRELQEEKDFPKESLGLELAVSAVEPTETRGHAKGTLSVSDFSPNTGGQLCYDKEHFWGWVFVPSVDILRLRLEHGHPVYLALFADAFRYRHASVHSLGWSSPRPPE